MSSLAGGLRSSPSCCRAHRSGEPASIARRRARQTHEFDARLADDISAPESLFVGSDENGLHVAPAGRSTRSRHFGTARAESAHGVEIHSQLRRGCAPDREDGYRYKADSFSMSTSIQT